MDKKNEKILEVKNLSSAYGEVKVLFDVSIEVKKGKIVSIVGRNGAGKTTLLKSIAGLITPTEGSISFFGENIVGMPAYKIAKKGLKYIDQDKKVFSDLTVKENLELSSYAMNDHNFDLPFKYFPKLKELLGRQAAHLSGGERQMLMIGRAVLGDPDVLLIDEPAEGLAPSIVEGLKQTFLELKNECTLVIVGQNLGFVKEIANDIYCMKEGYITHGFCDDDSDFDNINLETHL